MKIKISCVNIKEYDVNSNAYLKCGQEIEADHSQLGTLVQCPRCGGDVEVTHSELHDLRDSRPIGSTADDAVWSAGQMSGIEEANSGTDGDKARHRQKAPAPPRLASPSPSSPAANDSKTESQFKKERAGDVGNATLRSAKFDRASTCHLCGTSLADGQSNCPNCQSPRHAAYLDRKDRPKTSRKGPFGFQLWLDSITSQSAQNRNTNLAVHIFATTIMMAVGLILIFIGGVLGFLIGTFLLASGVVYLYVVWIAGKMRNSPRMPLPPLIRTFWNITLVICRLVHFGRIPQSRILDHRHQAFGDADMLKAADLNQYQMIDLEGSEITDEGLMHLYNMRGIRFLVVRETAVSEEAVQDLQQTIPRAWIWY